MVDIATTFVEAEPFAAPLRDRIAFQLRREILTGDLAAGVVLSLDQVAERFGTSRTPVREALIGLRHAGLIEFVARRGIRILGLTRERVADNYAIYGALVGVATEWTTRCASAELVRDLHRIESEIWDGEGIVNGSWQFHSAINRSCGSPRLRTLIKQASRTIPPDFLSYVPEQREVSQGEHADLIEAIEAGDAERARRIAERHTMAACERMLDSLAHRGLLLDDIDL